MKRYNPSEIEPKWQKYWEDNGTYVADLDSGKPKYMSFGMFTYPSGNGMHIGHAMNFTIPDVKARFKRQQGFESYHPIGWDSFGLPAENYAIKVGVSPQESMSEIIPNYRKQSSAMGWSYDWEKEIATHEPEYYKWTQWIFSEMYRAGLAYREQRHQWWCDSCQTVLANEQIVDGKCWRHENLDDPLVQKKGVNQWFFKITEYADELLEAIDELDWTESVKIAQRNWIGRSEGAEVSFLITESTLSVKVYTTRIDTIFSAAFLVLAPDNEYVDQLVTEDNQAQVSAYQKQTALKSELERQASKEKTGVFTGSYAVNPANGEKLPVWIADFVLSGYGTGAVFGDIHDERDFEFLQKYNIPARVTVLPVNEEDQQEVLDKKYAFTGFGTLIDSGQFTGMSSLESQPKIIDWLAEKNAAEQKVNYKMRDWSVTRQRYWGAPTPIVYCEGDCGTVLVPDENLPVILPQLEDFKPSGDGRSALARAKDWLHTTCPDCGGPAERETDTLDTYICSSWYMLRYTDPHNKLAAFSPERVNKWMPVDFYNGADHATAHMLYARFITRFFHKKGMVDTPEPFKQFVFNGKVRASNGEVFSKSKGNGIDPLEIINSGYGADALRMYLMFASPLELNSKWDPNGVPGTFRFLTRTWNIVQECLNLPVSDDTHLNDNEILRTAHKIVKKVQTDIEDNKFNTAISAMMGGLNELYSHKQIHFARNAAWVSALEMLVMVIAPFAPHIADELWHDFGNNDSIHRDQWPEFNEAYLVTDEITMAVQINGKVRAEITVPADADATLVKQIALAQENVQTHIKDKEIKKFIYIPGKITNIVV